LEDSNNFVDGVSVPRSNNSLQSLQRVESDNILFLDVDGDDDSSTYGVFMSGELVMNYHPRNTSGECLHLNTSRSY